MLDNPSLHATLQIGHLLDELPGIGRAAARKSLSLPLEQQGASTEDMLGMLCSHQLVSWDSVWPVWFPAIVR